ncbi:hypothetical protein [Nocardioides sp.]|uniref:hypothetical protein n=1 Tax=Nocardioides sp. TaxID=35761 RepID=UPI00260D15B4|nr:hypothetical protein [Nocardioides sp.]MCW2739349.1 hypothetical protein [Nocardioides sp.]
MTTDTSAPDGHVLTMTYVSSATRLLSVQQLVELIEQIRPKNERLGVTGLQLVRRVGVRAAGAVPRQRGVSVRTAGVVFGPLLIGPGATA